MLLSAGMLQIRALASRPERSRHPDGHLAEIRLIADICHNLPGADRPRPIGEYDPLVWAWQTSDDFKRSWIRRHLAEAGIGVEFLERAPLPPPAASPETRPTWKRWQLPRDPAAFLAVDSNTFADLVRQAREDVAAFEWFLDHLHPDGQHILRPRRPAETLLRADGPGDLRQYRALVTMNDGTLVVDHPRLRAADVAALPGNLPLLRRLQLAAVPPDRRELDAGRWASRHREENPKCRDQTY
ncbi:hypothetical protein GCM10009828_104700 [Actinoplanes couchii]|uniref:Uncharacterized protein n=1 Tax=Actinoplanes couchii TaxID=403638 RepID=A0ABQ3XL48_9ACTN|nr:hypothetical protein Aco03nite_076380 [Actinoplanes couchii]